MTRTRHARTTLARVLGAAVFLGTAAVLVVVWIASDGAESHPTVGEFAPVRRAAGADMSLDAPVGRPASAVLLLQPADMHDPAVLATGASDPGLAQDDFFVGVPRAWLTPYRIIGRVVDERGAPVAGASIRFMPDDATAGVVRQAVGTLPTALPSASSGEDGRFTLETWRGLPGAGMLPLSSGDRTPAVSITGPTSATLLVPCPGGNSAVSDVGTQVLHAGAVVSGRVVDGDGRPLAGLRVEFTVNPERAAAPVWADFKWTRPAADLDSTVTGAAGEYAFHHLGPGRGGVILAEPGWRQSLVALDPWTEGASVIAPDLVADTGAVLRGVVLDANGQPLPGVAVHAVEDDWWADSPRLTKSRFKTLEHDDQRRRAVTGPDGGFAIPGLDRRATTVIAGADDREPVVVKGAWPGGRAVEIRLDGGSDAGDGAGATPTFALQVVDADGASLDSATVLAGIVAGDADRFEQVSAERAGPGRFVVRRPLADGLVLLVSAPQHETRRVELTRSEVPDDAPVRVVLSPEARVDGIVRDDSGAPVPNAWVAALPFGGSYAIAGIVPAATDAEGRFTLKGLSAGNWPLDVTADGMLHNADNEVSVAAGEHVKDLLITLQRYGSISGRVRYADGSTPRLDDETTSGRVEVARIDDAGAANSWLTGYFDKEGRFAFRGRRPGDYELRTFEDEAAGPVVHVIAGQTTEVEIVVPYPPVVRGQVLAGDVPVVGALVQYEYASSAASGDIQMTVDRVSSFDTVRSDAEGRFVLTIAGAGSIAVWASVSGGGESAKPLLNVALDQEASVVLRMDVGRVQGTVVEAGSGAPVRGAQVRASGSFVAADADGRFELSHLLPGNYTLHAAAPGYLPADSAPLALASNEAVSDLLLELVRAANAKVSVLGPDGFPVDGAVAVVVWRADGAEWGDGRRSRTELTTPGGSVVFDTLPGGAYWIGLPDALAMPSEGPPPADAVIDSRVLVTLVPGHIHDVTLQVAEEAAR